jgi:putative oxidoreductase
MDEGKRRDLGLLILRVGIGAMFVGHGLPKLIGGPARWEALGRVMGNLGVEVAPTFFGFMAAISETGGGLLIAAGVLWRPALLLLLTTMLVAVTKHVSDGDGFGRASHAAEAAILFLALLFVGPGRFRRGRRA